MGNQYCFTWSLTSLFISLDFIKITRHITYCNWHELSDDFLKVFFCLLWFKFLILSVLTFWLCLIILFDLRNFLLNTLNLGLHKQIFSINNCNLVLFETISLITKCYARPHQVCSIKNEIFNSIFDKYSQQSIRLIIFNMMFIK